MRTSLIETREIEQHLQGDLAPADALLFEAKLIIDPTLPEKVKWQQRTFQLVQQYGRQQLRKEIEAVHQQLFSTDEHRSFKQKVLALFGKH